MNLEHPFLHTTSSKSPSEQQTHLILRSCDTLSPHSRADHPSTHSSDLLSLLVPSPVHSQIQNICHTYKFSTTALTSLGSRSPYQTSPPGCLMGISKGTQHHSPNPIPPSPLRNTTASLLIVKHKPSFCVESSSRYHQQRINQQVTLTMS